MCFLVFKRICFWQYHFQVRLQEIESRKKVDQFLEDIGNTDITDIVIEDWIMDVQAAARGESLYQYNVNILLFRVSVNCVTKDIQRVEFPVLHQIIAWYEIPVLSGTLIVELHVSETLSF